MENIGALNAALKSSVKKKEYQRLKIEGEYISMFLKLVLTLDSLEEAVYYLG